MKDLYAPWRSIYAQSIKDSKEENTASSQCVFCTQCNENKDEHNFILKRYKNWVLLLNKYPYNAGHLLLIPYEHIKDINSLTKESQEQMAFVINESIIAIQTQLKADGINIGINLGRAAGAGIPSHLHIHVLPRWTGDTNFLPTLANTKTVSFDLTEIYQILKKYFDNLP